MSDPLKPSATLLIKLGSMVVQPNIRITFSEKVMFVVVCISVVALFAIGIWGTINYLRWRRRLGRRAIASSASSLSAGETMNHPDHGFASRQEFLKRRIGWEGRLAICFFIFALIVAIFLLMSEGANAVPLPFRSVMCPKDWKATVVQRYDTRDRFDWIINRTWIARCY